MTDPLKRETSRRAELDAALADLNDERRKFAERQAKINETSTTVHSKDRMVSMTFDGRGELTKLTFNNTRYRRLASVDLAKVIFDTLAAGRRQSMEKLSGLMESDVLPGVSFGDMASGKLELDKVIESFLGAALEGIPDRISGSARNLLRGGS